MHPVIDIPILIQIARQAGNAILQVYQNEFEVIRKSDNSPITLADTASNEVINSHLTKHYPQIPIISEENKLTDYAIRKDWNYCWIIDPLDGTKEFVNRNGEFTINIALIEKQTPIFGLIYVPVSGELYYALMGKGSFYLAPNADKPVQIFAQKPMPGAQVITFASRSHINEDTRRFIEGLKTIYGDVQVTGAGSALKFCRVAEGKAHFYPRFSPCSEWDTAAGHIIATQAGATVTQPNGEPLLYNKENLLSPSFIVSA
ncbi:MAG TPA: 3'(2'),5'-bisphosphate nucleotidase CysQ [Chitinophagales bacterium]|nr:3'(2'),5'-bisphosphate nucleotidase CysQ [Chitinophagales bacterium]HRK26057.1 3'(2'),5'-bisphosphate nucleotidase CysQ [Chitinophagales bacterium]